MIRIGMLLKATAVFASLVLAFYYRGPGAPVVWAFAVLFAAGYFFHPREVRSEAPSIAPPVAEEEDGPEPADDDESEGKLTHIELVVEFYAAQLLDSEGYASCRKAIEDYGAGSVLHDPKWPGLQRWQFIFFGEPSAGETVVWSARYKAMLSDDCLIFEQFWQDVLEGKPEAKSEPILVFDLDVTHSMYRLYLRPKGPPSLTGLKATMICQFPVKLLKDLKDKDREAIAREHGLSVVEQEPDPDEDAFGEAAIYYAEGKEYYIYQFDQFEITFKVHHYWNEPRSW